MQSGALEDLLNRARAHGADDVTILELVSPRLLEQLGQFENLNLLSVYAMHSDPHYRALAVLHEAAPQPILQRLTKDHHRGVRALARARLGWLPRGTKKVEAETPTPPAPTKPPAATPRSNSWADLAHKSQTSATSAPPKMEPKAVSASSWAPAPIVETQPTPVGERMRLTDEQLSVLKHPPTRHLTISAYAGSGKTSTLVKYAEKWDAYRGLYLAFNSAIRKDASKKFPRHIDVKTVHGLAYGRLSIGDLKDNLQPSMQRRFIKEIAQHTLGIDLKYEGTRLISTALRNYLLSDDFEVEEHHLGKLGAFEARPDFALDLARRVLNEMMRFTRGDRPFTHDMYLKLYSLVDPGQLPYDYVMVDEAQDLNPVMIGIVRRFNLPLIVVGDKFQSIYAFRGAVSAMATFRGERSYLTRSWRFGDPIAQAANRILAKTKEPPKLPVQGNPARDTRILIGSASGGLVLARTNAGIFEYLLGVTRPFYIAGGFDQFEKEILAAADLYEGRQPDFASPLPFRSWDELREAADDEDPAAVRLQKLLDEYLPDQLRSLLRGLRRHAVRRPEEADVHLSTAHKAKGLESETVTLLGDFQTMRESYERYDYLASKFGWSEKLEESYEQELHLLYVAVTRAQETLYLPPDIHAELA